MQDPSVGPNQGFNTQWPFTPAGDQGNAGLQTVFGSSNHSSLWILYYVVFATRKANSSYPADGVAARTRHFVHQNLS
jgi:hypothetical protein